MTTPARWVHLPTAKEIIMANKTTRNVQGETSNNDAVLENVAATLSTALEQVTRMAKGTREILVPPATPTSDQPTNTNVVPTARPVARIVPAPSEAPQSLEDRVEHVLRTDSLGTADLAKALNEPVGRVTRVVRDLRRAEKVSNVGTEDHPLWTWRPGDTISTPDLVVLVRRLISERPMTTRELTEATGARFTRVGGAVVAIQRAPGEGHQILDLDPVKHAGRWFLITDRARNASISPKRRPKG